MSHLNCISLNTASFVSRQTQYQASGWSEGEQATTNYFRPLGTYAERLGVLLDEIRVLGFEAVDVWTGHLNPNWATAEHIAIARMALEQRGLRVTSLAGFFGRTETEFAAACRLAKALGAPLLAGTATILTTNRSAVLSLLRAHGLMLGIENESAPLDDVLAMLLDEADESSGDVLGAVVDTASFDENGGDSVVAVERLGPRICQVHLRNCISRANPEAARFDRGLVPMSRIVDALCRLKYRGGLSIEHVAYQFDPREDCQFNLRWLREQLGEQN